MGPGLRTGHRASRSASRGPGPALTPASPAPMLPRSGFLSLAFAAPGTPWSLPNSALSIVLSPLSRVNLLSSGFLSLENGASRFPF